eukprot:CAMPEP_0174736122 /NCGR_PEP_ID=MMETSP1094-20130205/66093_1 /TAXON_ID=156173 /ORGANISM="Chrysochromulina brevifilum, Strain UTEX LB 985" /LENGTH=72 /DNA_ID=CAMNT_0015939173 /DNA_START=50 /DNA_END=265 /DNA_ORIENTATION=+
MAGETALCTEYTLTTDSLSNVSTASTLSPRSEARFARPKMSRSEPGARRSMEATRGGTRLAAGAVVVRSTRT